MEKELRMPLLMPLSDMDTDAFIQFFLKDKNGIKSNLQKQGAVKFQGVQIESLGDFQKIVDAISTKFLSYVDGNSPRTKLSGNVYTSTEYDQSQKITMHNELSYSAKWPGELFFSCIEPAQSGGETLLADSREILKAMDRDIIEEISARGVIYIRNLHGGMGMGPSWQDTFETNDKTVAEDYCKKYAIEFEWHDDQLLSLKQASKGIIEHRETGERVWFNQIDQFHPSHLGEEIYDIMLGMYDIPEKFPMYVKFGDGGQISEDLIKEVLRTVDSVTIAPLWEKNELLIVDNELMSHGRNPFTGSRKVLVAMTE